MKSLHHHRRHHSTSSSTVYPSVTTPSGSGSTPLNNMEIYTHIPKTQEFYSADLTLAFQFIKSIFRDFKLYSRINNFIWSSYEQCYRVRYIYSLLSIKWSPDSYILGMVLWNSIFINSEVQKRVETSNGWSWVWNVQSCISSRIYSKNSKIQVSPYFSQALAASASRSWNEKYELEAMKLFKCVLTIGDSSAILSILQIPRVRREGQNAREVFFYRIFPD